MSEAEAGTTKQPDPTEKFRELRDAYLEIWSKNLIATVNSEEYAKASGAALDGYLSVAAPFKEPTEQAMLKTLEQLNMPSSADFAGLAGRFTNVELVLDNLDAKLDRIEKLLTGFKTTTPENLNVATESSAHATKSNPAKAISPKAAGRSKATGPARRTAPAKQSGLRAGKSLKRATIAKPVRQVSRKGAK